MRCALWFLWLSDTKEELTTEQEKEVKLREEYKVKLAKAVNLEALKKQREQVQQYVIQLEKQLPSKAEMDALLSDINQAGIGRSLQFDLFRPGQVVVKDYYAELPIAVRVSGRYHDIGAFAADISNLSRIVTLNSMSIVPARDGALVMDATAKTFRYLDADEINAQRTAAAKGRKMMMVRWLLVTLLPLAMLAGCTASSEDELRQWMALQKSQTFPKVERLSEPKQFKPETYAQLTEVEPFSIKKLTLALKKMPRKRPRTVRSSHLNWLDAKSHWKSFPWMPWPWWVAWSGPENRWLWSQSESCCIKYARRTPGPELWPDYENS